MEILLNNLYYLTIFLIGLCVVTVVTVIGCILEIMKYERKCILLDQELGKIKIRNMIEKKNM